MYQRLKKLKSHQIKEVYCKMMKVKNTSLKKDKMISKLLTPLQKRYRMEKMSPKGGRMIRGPLLHYYIEHEGKTYHLFGDIHNKPALNLKDCVDSVTVDEYLLELTRQNDPNNTHFLGEYPYVDPSDRRINIMYRSRYSYVKNLLKKIKGRMSYMYNMELFFWKTKITKKPPSLQCHPIDIRQGPDYDDNGVLAHLHELWNFEKTTDRDLYELLLWYIDSPDATIRSRDDYLAVAKKYFNTLEYEKELKRREILSNAKKLCPLHVEITKYIQQLYQRITENEEDMFLNLGSLVVDAYAMYTMFDPTKLHIVTYMGMNHIIHYKNFLRGLGATIKVDLNVGGCVEMVPH